MWGDWMVCPKNGSMLNKNKNRGGKVSQKQDLKTERLRIGVSEADVFTGPALTGVWGMDLGWDSQVGAWQATTPCQRPLGPAGLLTGVISMCVHNGCMHSAHRLIRVACRQATLPYDVSH
jgi:hypothetical protein